ncbi:MAG: hypothetical protein IIZ35_02290, partial [Clostridia bacterium]|nr:hypothetical protein [Clostridia bacterium]
DRRYHSLHSGRYAAHAFAEADGSSASVVDDYDDQCNECAQELFYSHVPIVESGVVTGVFSENSVVTWLVDGVAPVGVTTTFSDIKKYLAFDVSEAESYRFISGYERVSSIIDTFESATVKGDRVGMIFVTKNGRRDGELLGIITAWDVASHAD